MGFVTAQSEVQTGFLSELPSLMAFAVTAWLLFCSFLRQEEPPKLVFLLSLCSEVASWEVSALWFLFLPQFHLVPLELVLEGSESALKYVHSELGQVHFHPRRREVGKSDECPGRWVQWMLHSSHTPWGPPRP